MALNKGKLFAGALFAGLLWGPHPEQIEPSFPISGHGGGSPGVVSVSHHPRRPYIAKPSSAKQRIEVSVPQQLRDEEDDESIIAFVLTELYRNGKLL